MASAQPPGNPRPRRPAGAPQQGPLPPAAAGASPAHPRRMSAAELFSQLFPSGVQMTAEPLADLEQWARLTSKLAAGDRGTAP